MHEYCVKSATSMVDRPNSSLQGDERLKVASFSRSPVGEHESLSECDLLLDEPSMFLVFLGFICNVIDSSTEKFTKVIRIIIGLRHSL